MTVPDPGTNSVMMYRVGGRAVPYHSEGNCKTCRSPQRLEIEQAVLNGVHYATISDHIDAANEAVPARSIANHVNKHMHLDHLAMRSILDQRAQVRGLDLENGVRGSMVDPVALAQAVVDKTWAGIANGYLMPNISNGLKAATLLYNIGLTEEGEGETEDMVQAVSVFLEEAQRIMTPEQQDAFSDALFRNPILREMKTKRDARERLAVEGSRED